MTRLFHEGRIKIPYKWPAGALGTALLESLRDRQAFIGSRCAGCQIVYVPPRGICMQCLQRVSEVVPVGPEGTVVATAGGFGLIRLDGATTALLHRTEARMGARVAPRWAEQRVGSILDVAGFEALGQDDRNLSYGVPFRPAGATPRIPRVGILAIATTPAQADRRDWSHAEMVHEVVSGVLAETGLGHDDVDTMITASSDFLDGRTISDMAIQDVIGAPGKSASKVSMDGLYALLYAVARVGSGLFRTALVTAHAKASEGDPREISKASFDPIFIRPLGVTDHDVLRLQAARRGVADVTFAPDADGAVALLLADEDTIKRLGRP
ncbi:MAG TPA: zinc ribbon domain-containing protein, partial [Candidatus Xenobia bacterium]